MKALHKKLFFLFLLVSFLGLNHSCKSDDPSVIKIYVRSASNQLVGDAQVIIVGDVNSNPATNPYVDTLISNSSGFAQFNMAPYYDAAEKDQTVAYFDVFVKSDTKIAEGYIRSRKNTTAVESIFLPL